MLLHDARRDARVARGRRARPARRPGPRRAGTARRIAEGRALVERRRGGRAGPGPYQVQAAIAALHDEAPTPADTDWPQIAALYRTLRCG